MVSTANYGRARRPRRAAAHRDGSPYLRVSAPLRETLLILLLAWASNPAAAAEPVSNELLYRQLAVGGKEVSTAALDHIVKDPGGVSAAVLYSAVGVAVREKRIEDAGFLFYIARFRAQFDHELFPTAGTGGDSPLTALSALQVQWGSVVNPAVMGNPTMFATVLARVKAWSPAVPEGYHPGWPYSGGRDEGRARVAMENLRGPFLEAMGGLCTLLQDPAYFAAFRTGQDYNTLRGSNRPTAQAFQEAVQTMTRIEKEKGIQGIASQTRK